MSHSCTSTEMITDKLDVLHMDLTQLGICIGATMLLLQFLQGQSVPRMVWYTSDHEQEASCITSKAFACKGLLSCTDHKVHARSTLGKQELSMARGNNLEVRCG